MTDPQTSPPPAADTNGVTLAQPLSGTGRASRIGLWALALGLMSFLLWAALAPLDEGVPAVGQVSIDTKRKAVQHLSGGIVRAVMVKEGDLVRAGQPLIQMDQVMAKSNFESVRQRYLGLRAMQARLQAEQSDSNTMTLHPDLTVAATDPLVQYAVSTQQQLLESRRAALKADLQALQESVGAQEGMLKAYESMLVSRRTQQGLLEEELKNTRELVSEGYAPRNRQLELERSLADTHASIAELLGNTTRTQRTVGELRQRALSRQQEYRKEVGTHLTDATREVQLDAEKLTAVKAELERTDIVSPASGQVVGLVTQTVGGVIQPGQKLMDIVPENEPLLLEARIDPHLIDKVHVGLPTDIRFSAFAQSPQLVVGGEVQSISSDLLTEQQGAAVVSYYLARVLVTPEGLKTLGKHQMQPGMPAEIVIRTGERSMLTYLLGPLYKRVASSMKEE